MFFSSHPTQLFSLSPSPNSVSHDPAAKPTRRTSKPAAWVTPSAGRAHQDVPNTAGRRQLASAPEYSVRQKARQRLTTTAMYLSRFQTEAVLHPTGLEYREGANAHPHTLPRHMTKFLSLNDPSWLLVKSLNSLQTPSVVTKAQLSIPRTASHRCLYSASFQTQKYLLFDLRSPSQSQSVTNKGSFPFILFTLFHF